MHYLNCIMHNATWDFLIEYKNVFFFLSNLTDPLSSTADRAVVFLSLASQDSSENRVVSFQFRMNQRKDVTHIVQIIFEQQNQECQ